MKKLINNLTFQVITAIIIGVMVGALQPGFADTGKFLSTKFIDLISMLIAPVIFLTIVTGIAHIGDMKKVGRIGGKALLYFEIVTTVALGLGMLVANIIKPGDGVSNDVSKTALDKVQSYEKGSASMSTMEFIGHIIPHNLFEPFVKGDILQVLVIALFFGFGLIVMKSAGKPILDFFTRLQTLLFIILKYIMKLAPIGAFGAMAYTIGTYGVGSLGSMGKMMLSVYITMALFIFVVLNIICRIYKFSLFKYLKYIRQEILIVLGTSSSESALPSMMQKMERFGCEKSVVGLVIPTGYSFNLDGTSIYLSMAFLFLAQATNTDLSFMQQLTILGILMLTSKGAAAVTGGGFIVLASTLKAMNIIPIESLALLIGIDRFMSEGRAITNLIGNGVATVVIAKSEKQFDELSYASAHS